MTVLMPLPSRDFDPSEVAVTWAILRHAGVRVVFATPDGAPAQADPLMITGAGLDLWSRIPALSGIKALGLILRANADARAAHASLLDDADFKSPQSYANLRVDDFRALALPGGHARGMREYLESATLQSTVATFFDAQLPIAAICHGVVLAARSISPRTGRSVLHGRQTTALTWDLERSAWQLMRYAGRYWDADYYRTYTEAPGESVGYRSVQAEVTRALAQPQDFLDVPDTAPHAWRKRSGLFRDRADDSRCAFVVRNGNYLSARWPGDVHTFAYAFAAMLTGDRAALPL